MKTYQAVFNELEVEGVFGISLVENPAMEGLFVALNKHQQLELKEIDKEQRILLGLVLEPNKPVYRNQGGEEFNIVFNEETVKNLSYHFFKKGHQKNSTIEHQNKIEGVTFVESWIVEDPTKDKSANFGFSYPKGSWVAIMKVDDDDIWNNYVKTGKVQGFSVDAMLELKEVNLKSEINMSNKILEALRKIDARLGGVAETKETEVVEATEVTLMTVKTADGGMEFEYEGEELMAGIAIWANGEEGEKVPLPVGEYPIEGDKVIIVSEEGMIAEVKDAMVQEEEAPAAMTEAPATASAAAEKGLAEIKSILVKYQEDQKELANQITELKSEMVKLSEQPAAKAIKAQPVQVALNAKGKLLEKLRNNK